MTQLVVAIPTRDRSDLAVEAVESVLSARHPRVTAIVSDNSTEPEHSARLEAFCAGLPPDEVAYVRPPEPLPMAEHWEWLWRLIRRRAQHTHVAYLTDRMVFTASAIAELMQIVDREPARVVSYHHDRVEDGETPVALVQTQWTGRVLELDARRLIEMSSRGRWGDHLPRMLNSIVPVATLAAIEQRFGDVFGPVAPDYRFAYRCLATVDTILYLDRACLIHRGMTRSAGISHMRGRPNEHALRYERELSVARYGATPEPRFETISNAIFQEYCSVREEVAGEGFPAPDAEAYVALNAASIARIQDPAWRASMQELVRRHGWGRLSAVRHAAARALEMTGYFARHPGAFVRSVKRQFVDRPPGTPVASILPRMGLNPRIRDDLRFDTTAQAIAHANAHPRPRTPYAWHVHQLSRDGAVVRRA